MIARADGNDSGMTTPPDHELPPHEDPAVATPPGEDTPYTAATDVEPGVEPDPDLAEEYAESVPLDPTPEQVDHYLELVGDEPSEEAPPGA
jgi:hypothetical protein